MIPGACARGRCEWALSWKMQICTSTSTCRAKFWTTWSTLVYHRSRFCCHKCGSLWSPSHRRTTEKTPTCSCHWTHPTHTYCTCKNRPSISLGSVPMVFKQSSKGNWNLWPSGHSKLRRSRRYEREWRKKEKHSAKHFPWIVFFLCTLQIELVPSPPPVPLKKNPNRCRKGCVYSLPVARGS